MNSRRRLRLTLLLGTVAASLGVFWFVRGVDSAREDRAAQERLALAMVREDLVGIRACVAESRLRAGDRAGEPEVADVYRPIPTDARWLSPDEARTAIDAMPGRIDALRWWRTGLDPTKLTHALRAPAGIVSGCVHAARARPEASVALLARAREAAEFLVWAQERAGSGVFPFPAVRGAAHDNAFVVAERFLARAEKEGRLAEFVRNGWAFEDGGDGGLQFDNAEAGVALFELYEATKEGPWLAAALRASEWAVSRAVVPNWNYNAFSVFLLAKAFEVTGEAKYLAAAKQKARLGVVPGQLTEGPNTGRWFDAHNARPAYHYILLRGLASLVAVLPRDDPSRPEYVRALVAGLSARNREFPTRGAPTKDKAMEVLLLVARRFAAENHFLRDTASVDALDALACLVSAEARRGGLPLGPGEWGMFLEAAAGRTAR